MSIACGVHLLANSAQVFTLVYSHTCGHWSRSLYTQICWLDLWNISIIYAMRLSTPFVYTFLWSASQFLFLVLQAAAVSQRDKHWSWFSFLVCIVYVPPISWTLTDLNVRITIVCIPSILVICVNVKWRKLNVRVKNPHITIIMARGSKGHYSMYVGPVGGCDINLFCTSIPAGESQFDDLWDAECTRKHLSSITDNLKRY